MQINVSTEYDIGDILFLEQTNGGGLIKVIVQDIRVTANALHIYYVLNKRVCIVFRRTFIKSIWSKRIVSQADVIKSIRYARRGNNWVNGEQPPHSYKSLWLRARNWKEQINLTPIAFEELL